MDLLQIAERFGVPLAAFIAFAWAGARGWIVWGWLYKQERFDCDRRCTDYEQRLAAAEREIDEWKQMTLELLHHTRRALEVADSQRGER